MCRTHHHIIITITTSSHKNNKRLDGRYDDDLLGRECEGFDWELYRDDHDAGYHRHHCCYYESEEPCGLSALREGGVGAWG